MNDIMVSVLCNTYNHEEYIRQALDGFINQKTSFKYEVLIHDDASTDNTANIIREYEKKYPQIIKPIYQEDNKYSKGIDVYKVYQVPRITGKYVAFCEGDDYWLDEYKLQKQFDLLESNPDIKMCAHSFYVRYNKENEKHIVHRSETACVFSPEEVILGGGEFFSTNSLFYIADLDVNYPSYRDICPYDYFLQISGSLDNGVLYIPDAMSVYRFMASGSWTYRTKKRADLRRRVNKSILDAFKELDTVTNGKYYNAIKEASFKYGINSNNTVLQNATFLCKNLKYFNRFPFKRKVKMFLKVLFPSVIRYINYNK